MARNLYVNFRWVAIVILATCFVIFIPTTWGQISVITIAGITGLLLLKPQQDTTPESLPITIQGSVGLLWLTLFFVLLIVLPLLATMLSSQALSVVDAFYRAGALVFGGGHVVLPLLQTEVVSPGWVNENLFLAGYGATQAVPGPLFTFAAFLGINAAVVSLSLAALYQPVWTSAIHAPKDFGLALGSLIALMYLKLPPWLVVVGGGAVGWLCNIIL